VSSHAISHLLTEIDELHPIRSGGLIRLPELVGVPFTPRMRKIVDHPYFQRLRNVRQLSLSYLVYPGAVHTRFEHSLGVLETTTRYLTALLSDSRSQELADTLTRREVDSLLLAALLHDIGHYPFAHLMEDLVGEVADHIDLVLPFLDGSIADRYPSLALEDGAPSLAAIVSEDWPEADPQLVAYFISGAHPSPDTLTNSVRVLRSILDGPVDADKMDYLYRDSIHCGVPYGRFIDRDRFFQSLTVAPDAPDRIAVHEKGRICVELFGYARSAMYSEVYWHHASRAITAMLNRALREAMSHNRSLDRHTLMDALFARSDEESVAWLAENGGPTCARIMGDLNRRRLYKRLLVLHYSEHPTLSDMLDRVKAIGPESFDRLHDRLAEALTASGLLPASQIAHAYQLMLDIPPRRTGLADVPIIPEAGVTRREPGELGVWTGIRHDFDRWVRKIRLFIHPDLRDMLRTGESNSPARDQDRLINLLTRCAWEILQEGTRITRTPKS
jgi:HD superfamily phosphohydrolase